MADFSDFKLIELCDEPRWAHEIAGGVIPEMAQAFTVKLSDEPTSAELGQLVGAIGTSKVLRENLGQVQEVLGTDGSALEITGDWVERSGVQKPLDRSLWTPSMVTPERTRFIMTGAVANWQDRGAQVLVDRAAAGHQTGVVFYPAGNKIMNSGTEVVNENVIRFKEAYGELPTQSQYAEDVIAPRLREAGYAVSVIPMDTENGDEIADRFAESHDVGRSEPLGRSYTFVRVANAGIQLAAQFTRAMKSYNPNYDGYIASPAYILTDSFPIATTEDEENDAKHFQNPKTAIRMVALTAKMLQELVETS